MKPRFDDERALYDERFPKKCGIRASVLRFEEKTVSVGLTDRMVGQADSGAGKMGAKGESRGKGAGGGGR
jgi:hypothetical protein